jgi:hypothetical protein
VPKPKPAKAPKPLKAKPATPINVKPYEPEAPGARKWRNRIVGHDEVDAKEPSGQSEELAYPSEEPRGRAGRRPGRGGLVQEVIVNKASGFVVDGHARVSLAIKAGEKVPVVYVNRARWDLPFGRLHDVGESRALGPSDQFRILAPLLSARRLLELRRQVWRLCGRPWLPSSARGSSTALWPAKRSLV